MSLPHGEGGLKFPLQPQSLLPAQVPPPHGEGGLKLEFLRIRGNFRRSLPPRGGWIEMYTWANVQL